MSTRPAARATSRDHPGPAQRRPGRRGRGLAGRGRGPDPAPRPARPDRRRHGAAGRSPGAPAGLLAAQRRRRRRAARWRRAAAILGRRPHTIAEIADRVELETGQAGGRNWRCVTSSCWLRSWDCVNVWNGCQPGMNEVDLHTHTTASDGALTPAQLVVRAAKLALKILAITDHDSTEGIARGAGGGTGARRRGDPRRRDQHRCARRRGARPGLLPGPDPRGAEHASWPGIREGRIGRARKMAEALTADGRAGALRTHPGDRRRWIGGPAARCTGAAGGRAREAASARRSTSISAATARPMWSG